MSGTSLGANGARGVWRGRGALGGRGAGRGGAGAKAGAKRPRGDVAAMGDPDADASLLIQLSDNRRAKVSG